MLSYIQELVGYPGDMSRDLALGEYRISSSQYMTTYIVAIGIIVGIAEALQVRAYIIAHR